MKRFRVVENFTTAVITEIEMPDNTDIIDDEQHLIDAHVRQVDNWSEVIYVREIADNAGDSEFEIEEIKE